MKNEIEKLKKEVYEANIKLVEFGLVKLTWGNASAINQTRDKVVIKPSGISYNELSPENMVVVDMDGNILEGDFRPSSDTLTHLEIYKKFDKIYGVVHTHAIYSVVFAQSAISIPILGTTHADVFQNDISVTRWLREQEVQHDYEMNTGKLIVEHFEKINYLSNPGVLVRGHGPFTWGKTVNIAVENSVSLEAIAEMAYKTLLLNPNSNILKKYIKEKHFNRKHGNEAYYGQKEVRK